MPENEYPHLEELGSSQLVVGERLRPEHVLAIFVPDTALQISNEIPKRGERVGELAKIVACVLNASQS